MKVSTFFALPLAVVASAQLDARPAANHDMRAVGVAGVAGHGQGAVMAFLPRKEKASKTAGGAAATKTNGAGQAGATGAGGASKTTGGGAAAKATGAGGAGSTGGTTVTTSGAYKSGLAGGLMIGAGVVAAGLAVFL